MLKHIHLYQRGIDLILVIVNYRIKLESPSITYSDIDDKIKIALLINRLNYQVGLIKLQLNIFKDELERNGRN